MKPFDATTRSWIVLGVGKTGRSVISFLLANKQVVYAWSEIGDLESLQLEFPAVKFAIGAFPDQWLQILDGFEGAVVSPGLPPTNPVVAKVAKKTVLFSDFDLFFNASSANVLAVTGTNAKSTVVTLLAKVAECAGLKVAAGGNLGTPVLDLLRCEADVYVLECSSFQLQYTKNWHCSAAVLLNFSSDHLDHHQDLGEYLSAKQKIYNKCKTAVVNFDCAELYNGSCENIVYFSAGEPKPNVCGWKKTDSDLVLMFNGAQIIKLSECAAWAQSYPQNIAAAAAMAITQNWPLAAVSDAVKNYNPLPHRLEKFLSIDNIDWYDDSKATNVSAATAGVKSVANLILGKVVWLCGGLCKGADLSPLVDCIASVRCVICYGQDAAIIADVFSGNIKVYKVEYLQDAANIAKEQAKSNDAVLLAPACSSFDQFKDFNQRGDVFQKIVTKAYADA